jgi:hypothetical protein
MKLVHTLLLSLLACAAAFSATIGTAAADTTVTVSATKDAMIFGTSANADTGNASGKGPGLFAGADGSSNKKRSTIVFDIASAGIPSNATIVSVTMTMYLAQVAGSGGGGSTGSYPNRVLKLHKVQQSWGEGTSGSPTSPSVAGSGGGYTRVSGDSSWSYAIYSGTSWTAGGNFNATASASSTFSTPFVLNQAYTWSSAGLVTDVGSWVRGATTNYGWLVRSDLETSPTSFLGYWSRDGAAANSNPAIAPKLTIVYR